MARSHAAQRRSPAKELPSAPAGAYDDVNELLGVVVDHERRRGRGAQSNASGRYEPLARIAFDDGWRTLDELPAFKPQVTADTPPKIITRTEPPDPRLSRPVARARVRIQAVREAGGGGTAGKGVVGARRSTEGDRNRHQY